MSPSPQPPSHWIVSDVALHPDGKDRPVGIQVTAGHVASLTSAEEGRRRAKALGQPLSDYGLRPLTPAFTNGHTHLAMAPLRGIASSAARSGNVVSEVFFQLEAHLTAEDVRAFTRMGAYEALLSGTAEVWDHYYFGMQIAEALVDVGLSGVVAPTLQDLAGPGRQTYEAQLADTEIIHHSERLKTAGIRAAVGPHASDTVSLELFEQAAESAKKLGVPVHLHLAQNHEEVVSGSQRFKNGLIRDVASMFSGSPLLLAHLLYADTSEILALVAQGSTLAFCPFSQLQFGFLGPLLPWVLAGGGFAIGTDSVASGDAVDLQRELPLTALMKTAETGFSRERNLVLERSDAAHCQALEALRKSAAQDTSDLTDAVTLNAAIGAALPGPPRGLTLGAPANFLVLCPEHPALFGSESLARSLLFSSLKGAIDQVIVHGRPLFVDQNPTRGLIESADYRSAREEALRRGKELWSRAGLRGAQPT